MYGERSHDNNANTQTSYTPRGSERFIDVHIVVYRKTYAMIVRAIETSARQIRSVTLKKEPRAN